ncbi:putative secondary metabolism biosynthetic enzyme [Paraconiothyrium brasiliense]|uniref:Secondary metabolism biosynthetic enzyme n=1 Tax=Paraconiothyrium brasiliense TaxID=300254 RepID=A0ABR3QU99_9PLEO
MFCDAAHSQRAVDADQLQQIDDGTKFSICQTPLGEHEDIFQIIRAPQSDFAPTSNVDEFSVAYLHHTSGTSSGLPKPIPQSHRGAIGVLPHLPGATSIATFTTTPLYHGGIADTFRSWTSDSPIWLFPGKDVPITARNICKCLDVAKSSTLERTQPAVKYFSSVPYVLQIMEADAKGLQILKSMDIVGVGGAALPVEVGDRLVRNEVNLISRFDLFERHPEIENAWFYHSRADSQLTLITGKKFDPAPVEAAIATAEELDDVLIFGDNRPFPGALLLRSQEASGLSDEEVLNAIWPRVDKLNKETQDHARIPRHMLISVEHQDKPLEKSSKGTIIRKAAEARFGHLIKAAYETKDDQEFQDVDDKDLPKYLSRLIRSMIQSSVLPEEDTDLFSYGVDSIACMRLRSKLHQLTPNYNQELPLSVVEDCGTIRNLSNYIIRKRHGEANANTEDEEQMMLNLVQEYGDFSSYTSTLREHKSGTQSKLDSGETIVLTGATGALGAHILDLLRPSRTVSAIYCLVRGADETAAKERISKALSQRGLTDLSSESPPNDKVKIIQAALGEPRLGLSDDVYNHLAAEATSILHIAWTVNFRLKLRSFAKDNLAGVRHLLDLALAARRPDPPRFAYCSSTASIINSEPDAEGRLPEHLSDDPAAASPLGYSRSKWVAEQLCLAAHRETNLKGRISVIRVGQLSGDSRTGIWNTKEAWPMMLSTTRLINCLPQLGDAPLDWLPVDIAAEAFLQAASAPSISGQDVQVYHVLNPHQEPTWATLLQWLKPKESFNIVSPEEWVRRLEMCKEDGHSAMKLLGLWKEAYGKGEKKAEVEEGSGARFSIEETQKSVRVIREVKPLNAEYLGRIWEWVQENVH